MKKIILTLLATGLLLVANNLPSSITTTITKVSNNGEISLASSVPAGQSGLIVHNYGNGLSAITHTAVSNGSTASIASSDTMLHEKIPNIQTPATVGDKVIFGSFYDNALLIAPNQDVYKKITNQYNKTWIHPDQFALEFMKSEEKNLSFDRIKKFAQLNQIGLVLIVVPNKVLILDPISKKFLGDFPVAVTTQKSISPFYARFQTIDTSNFGLSPTQYPSYYQLVSGIK